MNRIAIVGAAGRMGGRLIANIMADERFELSGALEHPECPKLGEDAGIVAGCGKAGIEITADIEKALAGADTLATSYALSCCVKKLGDIDLVLCGRQAIDGDTAQVGPQIAEKLAIPQLCYVEEVKELKDKTITVRRAIEGGYEVLSAPLPALLTVIDANDPRPMNAHNIMRFKHARTKSEVARPAGKTPLTPEEAAVKTAELERAGLLIDEWSAADVNAAPDRIGFAGSPTKVKQVMSVILTASEAKQVEPTAEGINELIHELITDHTLG